MLDYPSAILADRYQVQDHNEGGREEFEMERRKEKMLTKNSSWFNQGKCIMTW